MSKSLILLPAASALTGTLSISLQSYIPQTLDQVQDYEKDQERIASGKDTEGIYYQNIMGLKEDLSGVRQVPLILEEPSSALPSSRETQNLVALGTTQGLSSQGTDLQEGRVPDSREQVNGAVHNDDDIEESSSGMEEEGSSTDESEDEGALKDPSREAVRLARKEHKKKVKEDKRESRKGKVPKALKKKKKKIAKAKASKR